MTVIESNSTTPATLVLDRATVSYALHTYSHDSRAHSYGDEAAAALGVDPRAIYKTLIVSTGSELVCAVIPVASRLNLKALASLVGTKRAELADPARAQRVTGYVLGGISPLGHRSPIPVWIDSAISELPTVFVSAGRRGLQMELAPADLLRLTNATVAVIATPP